MPIATTELGAPPSAPNDLAALVQQALEVDDFEQRIVDLARRDHPQAFEALGDAALRVVLARTTSALVVGLETGVDAGVRLVAPLARGVGAQIHEARAPLEQVTAIVALYQREAWATGQRVAADLNLPTADVSALATAGMRFANAFTNATVAGYAEAAAQHGVDARQARQELLSEILSGETNAATLPARSATRGWLAPERVRVAVALSASVTWPPQALDGHWGSHAVAVLPADLVTPALLALGPEVALEEASASLDVAVRLAESELVPRAKTLLWEDHLLHLVLTSDPMSASALADRELAPFTAASPRQREWLEPTLAAWLDHPGSPTKIARILHLHPQSTRYRLGQLRDLFGDALDDPAARLRLRLALAIRSGTAPGDG